MSGAALDPARKYLVPVARLNLPDEPDDVHLSVYEWNPRLGEWLHGCAICGRSVEQGRLPDGTQATCVKCLDAAPGYDKVLAEQAQIAAERAAVIPAAPPASEQLPDRLLALVGVPLYLSTACEVGHRLDLYRTDSPLADECAQWAKRMHGRCRLNNKFTGAPCSCSCHATTTKDPA